MNFVLKEWFSEKLHLHYIDEAKLPSKHNGGSTDICIHGHFNHKKNAGADHYYPEDKQYITLLRNPLKRQVSFYNYSRYMIKSGKISGKNHPVAKAKDIDDFLLNCRPDILKFFPSFITKRNFKESIEEHFVHVLILEDFQNSLNILAGKLGKPKIEVPHSNKVRKKERPKAETIEAFREKQKFEFNLYRFCKNLNQ